LIPRAAEIIILQPFYIIFSSHAAYFRDLFLPFGGGGAARGCATGACISEGMYYLCSENCFAEDNCIN